jgi:hypothetical protein
MVWRFFLGPEAILGVRNPSPASSARACLRAAISESMTDSSWVVSMPDSVRLHRPTPFFRIIFASVTLSATAQSTRGRDD